MSNQTNLRLSDSVRRKLLMYAAENDQRLNVAAAELIELGLAARAAGWSPDPPASVKRRRTGPASATFSSPTAP